MIKLFLCIVFILVSFLNGNAQFLIFDTVKIEDVVVTGTKIEVARKFVPITVSVVSKEEIENSSETAILPLLSEKVPGLFITERGVTAFGVAQGAAGQINMRGFGGSPTTQVLILIDGHPQFMGMMGHPLPDSYVASDAEKIEVIRGPGSILYGSNSLGGVINIITKKQHEDGFILNSKAAYGSFNTQKYTLSSGYKKNRLSLFGSVNHDRTTGERSHSEFQITNGYIKANYNLKNKIYAMVDCSLNGYTASDPGRIGEEPGLDIDILRGKTALSVDNKFKNLTGSVKVYLNFGEHNLSDGWKSNDVHYGLIFYQSFSFYKGNNITIGYDYSSYGGIGSTITSVLRDENGTIIPGETGPQFYVSDFNNHWISAENNALYTLIQQNVSQNFVLNAGLRYETNKIYGGEFMPHVGIAYNINKSTLKASFSKGYRSPSIRELYLFPIANENLIPESTTNYEMNWGQYWFKNKLKSEVTLFYTDAKNMIVKVYPNTGPLLPQYKNSGKFNSKGIETCINYSYNKNLKLFANYSFIDVSKPQVATPQHHANISVHYNYKKLAFNLKNELIANLFGELPDGSIDQIEEFYSVMGFQTKYTIHKNLNLFIYIDNLLNAKYQIIYGYPMPGINFIGGLSYRLK